MTTGCGTTTGTAFGLAASMCQMECSSNKQTNISGKPAIVDTVCTVLKPPTITIPKEKMMKTTTQIIRFQRLGSCPSSKCKLVKDDTMKADDEIVVAKKIKQEIQYNARMIILNGNVAITVATTAA